MESILPVVLSVLEFLSKATKPCQLNDYLLTFHSLGPKRWMEKQLENQAKSQSTQLFTGAPGIDYKGDNDNGLSFKPLLVEREMIFLLEH